MANCKSCRAEMQRAYLPVHNQKVKAKRDANKDQAKEKEGGWRKKNREKLRVYQQAYMKKRREMDPEAFRIYERQWFLRKNYGLTTQDYNSMLAAQDGKCAICRTPPTTKYLYVDHCHSTGLVRSLLCQHCNAAIGMAKESQDILARMINYLDGWQKKLQQQAA